MELSIKPGLVFFLNFSPTRPTTVEELGSILDKMRTQSKTVESNLGKFRCFYDLQFIQMIIMY